MILSTIDYVILISFFIVSLAIGILVAKQSGKNTESYFLSGRNMPWWLLGFSMVATTFAADTPNFVAGVIREDGVSGNWIWWSFLLTGMVTVFFYAKLWRKSGVTTDLEFYELRYSGRSAAFLRGFRAIYLGVFFNIIIMANVCLAAIKIGHVMFGFTEFQSLFVACTVTVFYSMLGGLRGDPAEFPGGHFHFDHVAYLGVRLDFPCRGQGNFRMARDHVFHHRDLGKCPDLQGFAVDFNAQIIGRTHAFFGRG